MPPRRSLRCPESRCRRPKTAPPPAREEEEEAEEEEEVQEEKEEIEENGENDDDEEEGVWSRKGHEEDRGEISSRMMRSEAGRSIRSEEGMGGGFGFGTIAKQ